MQIASKIQLAESLVLQDPSNSPQLIKVKTYHAWGDYDTSAQASMFQSIDFSISFYSHQLFIHDKNV